MVRRVMVHHGASWSVGTYSGVMTQLSKLTVDLVCTIKLRKHVRGFQVTIRTCSWVNLNFLSEIRDLCLRQTIPPWRNFFSKWSAFPNGCPLWVPSFVSDTVLLSTHQETEMSGSESLVPKFSRHPLMDLTQKRRPGLTISTFWYTRDGTHQQPPFVFLTYSWQVSHWTLSAIRPSSCTSCDRWTFLCVFVRPWRRNKDADLGTHPKVCLLKTVVPQVQVLASEIGF